MYYSLEHCLLDLEKNASLLRIPFEVDPNLEMAEIHRQIYEKKGPAILFEKIKNIAGQIDKTMEGTVAAELQKAIKGIETIEQKLIRSIKAKNETAINQIKTLKNKFFPENNIQERHDNFLPFYLNNKDFIEDIKTAFAKNEASNVSYLLLLEE